MTPAGNPADPVTAMTFPAVHFVQHEFQPNPDWVDAPYEIAFMGMDGMVTALPSLPGINTVVGFGDPHPIFPDGNPFPQV